MAVETIGAAGRLSAGAAVNDAPHCDLPGCGQPLAPKPVHGPQSRYCSKAHGNLHAQQLRRQRAKAAEPNLMPSTCALRGCTNPVRAPVLRGKPTKYCSKAHSVKAAVQTYRTSLRTKQCPAAGCDAMIDVSSSTCLKHSRETQLAKGRDGYYYRQLQDEIAKRLAAEGHPVPGAAELERLAGTEMVRHAEAHWSPDPVERRRQYDEITRQRRVSGRAQWWHGQVEGGLYAKMLEGYLETSPDDAGRAAGFLDRIRKALGRPDRRGLPAALREFRAEGLRDRIYAVWMGRLDKTARRGKPTASLYHWFATAWTYACRGQDLPSIQRLIQPQRGPGRPAENTLPLELRSRWGAIVLTAVVLRLMASGLSGIEVAQRFGWKIYQHHGRHAPMVTTFTKLGRRLRRNQRYAQSWQAALAEAGAYVKKFDT